MVQALACRGHTVMAVTTALGSNILMIKIRRYPASGTVAVIALCRSWQMIQVLAHGGNAVMTTRTSAQHLEVVHDYHGIPQVSAMTIFTDVSRADVVQALTGRSDTIVAVTTALGSNILMIEIRRYPASGTVAVIALCGGWQMIQILAHGSNTVMTTATGAQHLEVINRYYGIPQVGAVTVFTDVSGADVIE